MMKNEVEIKSLPRLYNVEFLRIFFTFCIFACHALITLYRHGHNQGRLAVEFFFILSGFFLYYTIDRQKNLSDFVIKKIIRFLPLMLFGEIMCQMITHTFSFQNYISLIFFLPSTGLTTDNYCSIGAVWYLCVLLWVSVFYFYLIKTQSPSTSNMIIGIIVFLSFIVFNLLPYNLRYPLFPRSILRGLICEGLGCMVANIYKHGKFFHSTYIHTQKQFFVFSFLEFFVIIYILLLMFDPGVFQIAYVHFIILLLILLSLFLCKRGGVSQFFDDDSWGRISKYCLSFFLTHLIIVEFLYYRLSFFSNLSKPNSFMVMLFLCMLLSIFAYHVIEKPCATYLNRWWNKHSV
ncbi:MAG: acyltransferase [Alphaproteobacteria bacterium]|nr:acyltransferase [Alphaproteobacteria bacterium]